jgi:hypothetical protein
MREFEGEWVRRDRSFRNACGEQASSPQRKTGSPAGSPGVGNGRTRKQSSATEIQEHMCPHSPFIVFVDSA